MLESLPGWSWNPNEDAWNLGFKYLKEYCEQNGHCVVPTKLVLVNGFALRSWIVYQRQYRDVVTIITPERKALLESLPGWSWDPNEDAWNLGFKYLKEYCDENGHCRVISTFICKNNYKLGSWVTVQRKNKDLLSAEKKTKLESLPGWSWDPHEEAWNLGFKYLKEYCEKNGDCLVPKRLTLNNGYVLGSWVSVQRKNKDLLSAEKKTKLESLPGWSWDPNEDAWNLGFKYLKEYCVKNGDCLVPQRLILENGFRLGNWVSHQREFKSTLSEVRIHLLDDLEFVWDPLIEKWQESFNALNSFKDRQGHCIVPKRHIENDFPLGQWVRRQRSNKSTLSEERLSQLNELGFVWSAKR